ncbi:MAG TPA: hypothetical protein VMM38_12635 [Aridibacter sp.]|nr:hypothetical protein [Aridibacter sp.]
MKAFDFYTFLWWFKPIKNYVNDYAELKGLRDAARAKSVADLAVVN